MRTWLGIAILLSLLVAGCESTNDANDDKSEKILYYSDFEQTIKMYSMNPDGSNKKRIYNEDLNALLPIYSPDKSKIAFVFLKNNYFHLGVIKADGSGFSAVEAYQECHSHSWSPDGTKIAFSSKQIFVNEDYLVIVNLKDDKVEGFSSSIKGHFPLWLPNSNKLIYRYNLNMYSINIDGTEKTKLIDSVKYYDCSPDGTKIVFFIL
jgi:Tol biopolymer transport system component